jgi:RNA-directed DNA polymerase
MTITEDLDIDDQELNKFLEDLKPKVVLLRQRLGQKAKNEPKFRFYSLYGHICSRNVLEVAWKAVCRNKGAPGVDDISIEH